jgi:hypothetical protein
MNLLAKHWKTLAIWLVASCIATVSCVLSRQDARIGDEYFPMGNDAFYHAARILDAVREPSNFYEFDPKIHAPEGSLLVWPWGYDYVLSKLVRIGLATGFEDDPLQILLWLPVVAVSLALALLIFVARKIELSTWPTALGALCMALLPTTQWLYGFGQIDHHLAEMIFVLATLGAGLAWFGQPRTVSSVVLGCVFGISLAVHNGLFILQLPFLATLFIRWLQGQRAPSESSVVFVAALLISALCALVPSTAFRTGRFEFYTLSWFHLYIVCCTGLIVLVLAHFAVSRRTIAGLTALSLALVIPLLGQIELAGSFVTGSLGVLDLIQEMQSPITRALHGEAWTVTLVYTLLIWLAPATVVLCAVLAWRERHHSRLLFWIACVGGLGLLSMQMRMHYFGSFALYLPWLYIAEQIAQKKPSLYKRTFLVATLLLLLAYVPQIRHVLVAPMPRAGDASFEQFHAILPALRKACREDPGVVLADADAGHYIRYYTECSVIANNFLLTEQQFRKVDEMLRLFAQPPVRVELLAPYVKYILIRPAKITPQKDGSLTYSFFVPGQTPQLAKALLLGHGNIPSNFRLLAQVNFEVPGLKVRHFPYVRLYKIEAPRPESYSSSNRVM